MIAVYTRLLFVRLALGSGIAAAALPGTAAAAGPAHQTVVANDNRSPAGRLADGTLTLALRAGVGRWRPEGPATSGLEIEAFGEEGSSLSVPAPLLRVREGAQIVASIRNDLTATLIVHGLCARDGSPCPLLEVPPSETREVRFTTGRAGTYHYWASTMGLPIPFRELAGAFIVDPLDGAIEPDRVLVITEWNSLAPEQLMKIFTADDSGEAFVKSQPRFAFMINGLSWPATERLTYHLGDTVRWRVINLSTQSHPMHLHGFYFDVDSLGDGLREQPVDDAHRHSVVTQLLPPATTMALTWRPEREGNWLFHCHVMHHVSSIHRLEQDGGAHAEHAAGAHGDHHPADTDHADHDGSGGMAGMVLGVTVLGDRGARCASRRCRRSGAAQAHPDHGDRTAGDGDRPVAGFVLSEPGRPAAADQLSTPGPAIVLRRDEPVEITLVNQLREATAIHWHGMELDSYYDGVHGWSGASQQMAPMIEPGGTFVVRFTPPRAGTFIYHTHMHDFRQLSSGLYGPMIVLDPGETFDPATDHVLVLGRKDVTSAIESVLGDPATVMLNGEHAPRFVWQAGVRHRVRLINITPDDIFFVSLQTADAPAIWTPLTKDGAPLPTGMRAPVPARQLIAVGETYDFEYQAPAGRKTGWIEVRTTGGKWQAQGQVIIR